MTLSDHLFVLSGEHTHTVTALSIEAIEKETGIRYREAECVPSFGDCYYDHGLLEKCGLHYGHNQRKFSYRYWVPKDLQGPLFVEVVGMEPLKFVIAPRIPEGS